MTIDPLLLRWLAARGGRAHGRGGLWTVLVLLVQLCVALSAWGSDLRPRAASPTLGMAAQVVVQPPLGQAPGALESQQTWPVGSRLQLSFAGEQEGWSAVLWLSGDTATALYPNPARDQRGWTAARAYAVPGDQEWMRLTPTAEEGDTLALITAWEPVPEVVAVLDDPSPIHVAALRRTLAARDGLWFEGGADVERFLPTADGRAVPVSWRPMRGGAPLVRTWTIRSHALP